MPIVTIEEDEPILDITPIEFEDSLALSPPSPPTPVSYTHLDVYKRQR